MEQYEPVANQPMSLVEAVDQIVTEEQASQMAAPARTPFDPSKPTIIEPVEIELDRTRHMRLPFWALRRFQTATGVSPWDHERVWGYPPDLDLVIHLLWASLLDEDPELTVDQVERMPGMDFANAPYIQHCLGKLWGITNPDPQPAADGGGAADPNPPTAPASTG